jgi:putative MFS transporter
MSAQSSRVVFPTLKKSRLAASIIARQDRIPIWALPRMVIVIIGLGLLFTFFDIGDINVSFIQTCTQIVPHCLPLTASSYLGFPVLMNLLGYVLGALIFSPLADRYGRRDMMVVTMAITGLGSLYTAFVGNYGHFVAARTLTGVGIGADLALVNTYVNEVAPKEGRARYTSLIFIMSSTGASLGIWLGFYLTTPPAPFPYGLPIALASPQFESGWRILYLIGASLAFVGLLLRFQLPESPRWLITKGRLHEAERVVRHMEEYARQRLGSSLPPPDPELQVPIYDRRTGYREIFNNTLYFKRTILLLVIWLLAYITVYSNISGLTTLLVALQYPVSEAGLITSCGVFGSMLCALSAYLLGEYLERKIWLLIAALLTMLGEVTIAQSGNSFGLAALGSIVLGMGAYIWLPVVYTWSTENYPTRARASGFALVDGVGHIGGGIGVSYVTSLVTRLGPGGTFLLIGSFLMLAALLAQFGPSTRHKRLDEVSP